MIQKNQKATVPKLKRSKTQKSQKNQKLKRIKVNIQDHLSTLSLITSSHLYHNNTVGLSYSGSVLLFELSWPGSVESRVTRMLEGIRGTHCVLWISDQLLQTGSSILGSTSNTTVNLSTGSDSLLWTNSNYPSQIYTNWTKAQVHGSHLVFYQGAGHLNRSMC